MLPEYESGAEINIPSTVDRAWAAQACFQLRRAMSCTQTPLLCSESSDKLLRFKGGRLILGPLEAFMQGLPNPGQLSAITSGGAWLGLCVCFGSAPRPGPDSWVGPLPPLSWRNPQ